MSSQPTRMNTLARLRRLRMATVLAAVLAALALTMPAVAAEEAPESSEPTATPAAPDVADENAADEGATPSVDDEAMSTAEEGEHASSEPGVTAGGSSTAQGPAKVQGPKAAQADADWPAGWPADPELPQGCDGDSVPCVPPLTCDVPCQQLSYGLNPDPYLPQSIADLKQSPEPTCAAPALPAPTQAGSPLGYTVPIRIKLTNGVVLAGYSKRAAFRDQPVPFTIVMSGLTGWVVGRVSLPSLQVHVDPGGVRLCDYDRATNVGPLTKAFQVYGYGAFATLIAYYQAHGVAANTPRWVPLPGTTIAPWPGSLGLRLSGLDNMGVKDAVAQQIEVETSGVASDGSLELATQLVSGMKTDPAPQSNGQPNTAFTCDVNVGGTFGTAAKQTVDVVAPTLANGYTPFVPARQEKVYLPTRTLTGAVEGGTATVGSNWFEVGIPATTSRCGGAVNGQFYGYGFHDPAGDTANLNLVLSGPQPPAGLPIVPGLVDLSLDMTVDRVGLPKPTTALLGSYGFE